MNNILLSIKKFFTNKNVVTVLGVIIILVVLYWGYTTTINEQIKPTSVPVATVTIQPRTRITEDMIKKVEVPSAYISKNVEKFSNNIIGKYSAINSVIPSGSLFYKDVLIDEDQIPDSAFTKVKDGERPYALAVDIDSTYGNSIFPGNKIDVFMKATDENGMVMVGRLLAQIEVLAVKDSAGKNVFENTAEDREPARLLYGVPEDVFILLKKAEYLRNYGVELFPVPYGGTTPIEGDIQVDREELVHYIENNTVTFPDKELEESDELGNE